MSWFQKKCAIEILPHYLRSENCPTDVRVRARRCSITPSRSQKASTPEPDELRRGFAALGKLPEADAFVISIWNPLARLLRSGPIRKIWLPHRRDLLRKNAR
jgi:hypothetical protein